MGSTFQKAFPELWDDIQGVFELAEKSGRAVDVNEIPLFTERNGFLEETYFTGNFNPVRDIDGSVGGFYNAAHEVTKQKISSRRAAMINAMLVPSSLHKGSLESYVMPILELNPRDITMSLLYTVDEETVPGTCSVHLRGSIGVPTGHKIAVKDSDLDSTEGLMPMFRRARSGIITEAVNELFDSLDWKGFGEPSINFSILPLAGAGRLFGFLVLGLNPRRPIDDDHHQFARDVAAKVSSIAASVVSGEETRKREERVIRELRDSERQIRFMAQHATVGMQHCAIDGTTIWANDQFYKLTGLVKSNEDYELSFLDIVIEEEKDRAMDAWKRLLGGEPNISMEVRLKRMFTPPNGEPEHVCVLVLAFPYTENGEVKSTMSSITDISQLKWAESIEARKAADAREAKRQQEEFIDIVSHEMRNPLSAIFQCAEMIQSSLAGCEVKGTSEEILLDALHSNADAASTILMCANHQKRIVDDVLTLSKLEYMMLSISPRPVQPVVLVERAMRMFEADLDSHRITVKIIAEPSLKENDIDWVLCDPSRVAQIFINLLTNAIKFTKGEPKREITVSYGATMSHPRASFSANMNWAPTHEKSLDLTEGPEWGDGEALYLSISITDTGVGMTSDEIHKLFHRFEQASSKTSIKYGGSGLGLFISQKLTEKQGGEIGVCSDAGKGSTFAFYVKARRTEPENAAVASKIHRPVAIRSKSTPRLLAPVHELDEIHVLLVEDNIVNQKVLCKQLTKAGCTVYIANHGVEALNFLRETDTWYEAGSKHLDIILMDCEMPIMDGLTCSREIRALQKAGKVTRHIDIIAITANAREEQIQNALASGIVSSILRRLIPVVLGRI